MVNNKRLLIEKRYPFQCDCVRVFTDGKERPHQSLSQGFAEIIIMRTPGVGKPTNGEISKENEGKNSPRIPENLILPIYIDLYTAHVLNLSNHVLFIAKEVWEFMKDWLWCIKNDASSIFAEIFSCEAMRWWKFFLAYEIGNSNHAAMMVALFCLIGIVFYTNVRLPQCKSLDSHFFNHCTFLVLTFIFLLPRDTV